MSDVRFGSDFTFHEDNLFLSVPFIESLINNLGNANQGHQEILLYIHLIDKS